MAVLWERLKDADQAVAQRAKDTVRALVAILGQEEATVLNLIENIYEDSQVNLIWDLWFRDDE